jgi:HAD superfamily hydrolase (TIGR01509 family)
MIRALVFDFDGLILDTEGPVYTAWADAFERYGCGPLTIDEWAQEIGTINGLDLVGMMRTRATVPFDEAVMHEERRVRREELVAVETVLPGVHDWLDAAAAHGLAVAIASSSRRDWVLPHLARLDLADRFAFVSCGEGGVVPKPAPDTYLAACAALGVEPSEAIALEDSPNGVKAARAAGLRCIAVPHPVTAQLDLSDADLCVPSLAAMTLSAALDALGERV